MSATKDQTYQGWTNYETWAVKLFIDNERKDYEFWKAQTKFLLSDEGYKVHRSRYDEKLFKRTDFALLALMELLKEKHEEKVLKALDRCQEENSFIGQLLNGAISAVNWREIADSLIETANES